MKTPAPKTATLPRAALLLPLLGAVVLLLALAIPAHADDKADMERTKIIGNRELPKVLYIVPWKKPVPGELPGRPLKSVLDEALDPVDREVFQRQVQYQAQVAPPAGAAAMAATPAPDHK
jgi:hypothetical protein